MQRRHFIQAAAASACLPPLASFANDNARAISLYVGFPPGGSVDSVGRTITPHLQEALRQNVIIENKPGAGGRIALEALKAARPDGLAMLISPASMFTIYPTSFKALRYDPLTDFVPVAGFMDVVSCFVISNQIPATTFNDYLKWVKEAPGARASFGSPAEGSMPHFLGMTTMQSSGLPVAPVPYKGAAPLIADVMGGHIHAGVAPLSDAIEHHLAGKLRIVAVGGAARFARLPNVPTFRELGLRVTGGEEWYGAFLPKGTPQDLVDRYRIALFKALQAKEVKDQFEPKAWMVHLRSGPELRKMISDEIDGWRKVLAALNYAPQ